MSGESQSAIYILPAFPPQATPIHRNHHLHHSHTYNNTSLLTHIIMKLISILSIAAQVACVLSAPADPDSMGLEGPQGRPGEVETPDTISKRGNCYYDTHLNEGPYKCGKSKYCFKECDKYASHGKWCWAAWNKGNGNWVKCNSDWDCRDALDYRIHGDSYAMCAKGDCKDCGCFCN